MLFTSVKIRKTREKDKSYFLKPEVLKITLGFCAIAFLLAINACRSPQTIEMRSLLPNNAIAYLETNDLAKTLKSVTDNQAFQELADKKTDFSALENMQLAVAVTGFETSLDDSILNFKPQFVTVVETHAWSWQTVSFVENQLDNFVRVNYGADAKLETSDRDGRKFFNWTAKDNRQVFAFVQGSLIYFGTDAATIEKCLAIKKGEADSLMENESLSRAYSENNLAFGYVSTEGIKQIADFAGVNVAVEATEESGGRSFIARVLPQILQNTAREIVWTANTTERGIEDVFSVSLNPEVSAVVKETLATAEQSPANSIEFLPSDFFSATRYNLRNPLIAWRSLLLMTARNTDALSSKLLIEFSDRLLEPYKISSAENFLSAIDSEIITAQFDAEGEKSVAIVIIKDTEKLKNSISKEINFKAEAEKQANGEIWFSEDKQSAAAFIGNNLILGESESVLKCLQAKQSERNITKTSKSQKFVSSQSAAVTFARDEDSAEKIVTVLAKKKDENRKLATFYSTETRITEKGIERKTVSDFGMIGTILNQLVIELKEKS